MKAKLFFFGIFILTITSLKSQTTFQRLYQSKNSFHAQAYSVQQTNDGGYIMAGIDSASAVQGFDYYLVKTNSTGDTLWTRTYGTANNEYAQGVQQTADGGYIIAGSVSTVANDFDIYVVKTNSTGDTLWTKQYSASGDDEVNSIQQTSDLGYIICGYTNSFNSYDYYLLKTTSTGALTWARNYGGAADELGYYAQQTSDGGYVITGATDGFSSSIDILTVKTNSAGDTLWSRNYGTPGTDWAFMVKQTTDGGYVIAGYTGEDTSNLTSDMYVIKTNSTGDTLWAKAYGGTSDEQATAIVQTTDGGYAIAGFTSSYGVGGGDACLVKTNANGTVIFSTTYGETGSDWAYDVKQTTDKGFILGGYSNSFSSGEYNFYLVKTDSTGIFYCHENTITIPLIQPATTVIKPSINQPTVTPNVLGTTTKVGSSSLVSDPCLTNSIKLANANDADVKIYPNPTNGIINLELKMQNEIQNTTLVITDMLGNTVKQFTIHNSEIIINAADLNQGVYTISVTANQQKINKRLIIVK